MNRVLIGATGFVGGSLRTAVEFDLELHRSDIDSLRGHHADLIVCAGLPAAKWLANNDPVGDFENMCHLAAVLDTVTADRFVLISTIDVYSDPRSVDERTPGDLDASQAYGRNRAWFERFVQQRFPAHLIVRLPALFGTSLKKNLVFDLLEHRPSQYEQVHAASTFQFWNVDDTWALVERAEGAGLATLNIATEPVAAGAIAALFGVELAGTGKPVEYDMHTCHAERLLGRSGPYLLDAPRVLHGIQLLRDTWAGRS